MKTAILELKDERIPELAPPYPMVVQTPSECLAYLLTGPHLTLPRATEVKERLQHQLADCVFSAFVEEERQALLEIHEILYLIYELSFANPLSPAAAHERSPWLSQIRETLESAWLAYELPGIQSELPSVPASPRRICEWFEAQAFKESDLDRRVVRFLAEQATLEDFVTFIVNDGYLNYRFYDALALAQPHYSETVKAEIVRHMWDECGDGNPERAHTRQFARTLMTIGHRLPATPPWQDWRPFAGYNLYFLFGLNRRHYFKALGSLAMPELFDPDRDRAVVDGLRRLGFQPEKDFEYYYSHIEGDEEHGPEWLDRIIRPIVEVQPEAALDLAIGGALRMAAMSRYNEYLATQFGLVGSR